MKPIFAVAALTFALTVPTAFAANHSIVPGQSIGQVSLGESMDKVSKVLGPADSGDAAMGKAWSTWYSKPGTSAGPLNRLDIYSMANFGQKPEGHRVRLIRATSPFFRTSQGVSTADNLATIKRRFPGVRAVGYYDDRRQRVVIYDDVRRGISFDVARVSNQGDASSRCLAITVHPAGISSVNTYLPLHPDFKRL